ncbi:MAG: Abi family protein, partial [Candidatus Gracilibacteria bacterium]|nr:Abi family protein [Candidatus Gracilibacteria bacterium]
VLDEIEKIEISLKSVINNYMSELDGCYWYLNTNNFYLGHKTIHKYGIIIIKFNSKKYDKDSEIAKNFFEKYDEEYLPSWKLFEELTIGEISTIYRILLPIHKEKISKTYIVNFKDLSTWI